MPESRTVGELRKAAVITSDDVDAAVDAYLRGETVVPLGKGYRIDVPAAIEAHKPSRELLADPKAPDGYRRTMVLTAIILARPEAV